MAPLPRPRVGRRSSLPWILAIPLAYVGITFVTVFVKTVKKFSSPKHKRKRLVMGNANSLMQSDDWAALITDAKPRSCYTDMDSLPKDFFGSRGMQGKGSSSIQGLRSSGPRLRPLDMHMESRLGMPSQDDEQSGGSVVSRNGNYRPFRPQMDN